ncbi:hypothetical protein FQN60_004332 [Etheostoma spectabile]|uniref:VHS domain-containing protein n=1 Tax=Etheostoma spectabile TaxID=54343 RepID=A0A5J5CT97_9PERO|nr:hypothetical protein FQN60_004332 [Etheostoma spectabile]
MEFLMGNPFSTPVGQRIENATGSSLPAEDWALNMEICDMINSLEEGPRDAIRALKKRIVLETCVKNCGYRFHILVTTRDFVEGVLVRAIIPRNNPPLVLHDRVLGIIQAWADAFRSSPDLTGVVSTLPGNGPAVTTLPAVRLSSKPPLIPPQTSELKLALEGNTAFTPSQIKQLKTELGVVRTNLTMMSDMMSQLDPVTLYTVCKEMQDRIVKIVPRLSEERLIEELLAANDEMNTAFTRYHRFERRIPNGQNSAEKSHTYVNLADLDLTPESVSQSGIASVTNDSAYSLSKADSVSSQMARLSAVDGPAQAQHRRLHNAPTDDSPASTRSSSPKLDWMIKRGMIPINQSTVMDDIEKWLELDDEFDRFLAERAKAAERLPSVRASPQDANHSES